MLFVKSPITLNVQVPDFPTPFLFLAVPTPPGQGEGGCPGTPLHCPRNFPAYSKVRDLRAPLLRQGIRSWWSRNGCVTQVWWEGVPRQPPHRTDFKSFGPPCPRPGGVSREPPPAGRNMPGKRGSRTVLSTRFYFGHDGEKMVGAGTGGRGVGVEPPRGFI
jgi:hypothetical protein